MKNRKIILSFLLILVLVVSLTVLYKNNKKSVYLEQNGILFAISDGNGNTLSNVPDKGLYEVTVDCNNAEGSWDYNNWKIVVKNITGNVSCDLTFKSVGTSQTFAQYITSLSGTNQGNGKVVNENGYRYEGKDPNNYIWFNNEMWRIIGVFGSNRHGVSSTNLVKLIRNQSIGSYSWNGVANYPNNYATSTIYYLLNGCYYNALNSSGTTNISGSSVACTNYCVTGYSSSYSFSIANCDFSVIGIQNDGVDYSYRDMIQNVTWYLGGPGKSGYRTYYPDNIYGYETNTSAVYSGRTTSVTANVGLMYISDYGYSVLASSCARGSYDMYEDDDTGYANTNCAGNSWIFGQGYDFTIGHDSGYSSSAWRVDSRGSIFNASADNSYGVRPVVYLKTKTYKLAGTGTKTDPYIVGKEYEYSNTFNYSSSVQTLSIAKAGYYKLEVYGAGGGTYNTAATPGKGGYAKGVIHLNQNDTLYIHTGGKGSYGSSSTMSTRNGGGTNGGGGAAYRGGGGGGATDIRINTDTLYARAIVGGGGGGAYYNINSGTTYTANGGNGGGTSGSNGSYYSSSYSAFIGSGGSSTAGGAGGTSSSGGNYNGSAGTFGNGGNTGYGRSTTYYSGGAGGGGWYGGGGAANYNGNSRTRGAGGGGGSSYIYSSSTASQVPSGYLLGTEYRMTSTSTTAGSNTGDGYAKVTYCGQAASDCS